jgi:hypothetical protein
MVSCTWRPAASDNSNAYISVWGKLPTEANTRLYNNNNNNNNNTL